MSYRRLLCALVGSAVLAAACASAPRTADGSRAGCALQKGDTLFLAGGPVYRDCAVDVKAERVGAEVRPDFRPTGRFASACFVTELEFVVDTMGVPELGSARIVRTNDRDYGNAVFATLPQWKYQPARLGNARVRQIVSDKRGMSAVTVLVPAGSSPRPPTQRPQKC